MQKLDSIFIEKWNAAAIFYLWLLMFILGCSKK